MTAADQEEEDTSKRINLTIRFPGGGEDITIKVKPTTKFEKVYKAVANSRGVAPNSFKLLWDETRLGPEETPKMHEFEDEEQLDYFVDQVGGSDRA